MKKETLSENNIVKQSFENRVASFNKFYEEVKKIKKMVDEGADPVLFFVCANIIDKEHTKFKVELGYISPNDYPYLVNAVSDIKKRMDLRYEVNNHNN